MEYKERPDYGRCVAIVTSAYLREMIKPGALAVILPILIFCSDFGMLTGYLLLGVKVVAVLIETGAPRGKGIYTHKAAVTVDTVEDPYKGTVRHSLHVLIRILTMIMYAYHGCSLPARADRGPIFLGSPDLPSALIGKKELGSLGAPEFRPSSPFPSLFLVGCDQGFGISSSLVKRVGGACGFCRASGFWLCNRSLPVVTGSNRGSKDQVCGALSGCCEEDPCAGSSLAVLSSLCFWWFGRVLYWVLVLCLGGVDVCAVTALPSNVIFV
ncbi:hypothetical protein ACOSQ4_021627 [Xanthoceras sorbifolium]